MEASHSRFYPLLWFAQERREAGILSDPEYGGEGRSGAGKKPQEERGAVSVAVMSDSA
jgi:hypothetical protein